MVNADQADEDEDGIGDACEGESMMGGSQGEQMYSLLGETESDRLEAGPTQDGLEAGPTQTA